MNERTVLHCTRYFYADSSNGAAAANRALMECLARNGFAVEALCGSLVDVGYDRDPADLLDSCAQEDVDGGDPLMVGAAGVVPAAPPRLRSMVNSVPLTIHRRPTHRYDQSDPAEAREFLSLVDAAFERLRPDVLVTYGGDPVTLEMLARARGRGITIVFTLHNFAYPSPVTFANVDAVIVGSRFSAEYHRRALGLRCAALSNLVKPDFVRAEDRRPDYVVYVNPSIEKGVYAFARIAEELGRRRPDIRLLVVESRGTEATLVGCGIDLRDFGNVFLMSQTPDPRDFWKVARICIMPSLWWENQPLVAVEAMINGVPVIASDRGGLPETLGGSGIVLPLPDRLTPATCILPTAEEVAPWVDAIIALWDAPEFNAEHERRALAEARRWAPDVLEPQCVDFFSGLGKDSRPIVTGAPVEFAASVVVPYSDEISSTCERSLEGLIAAGVRVIRRGGDSDVDAVRNALLSESLHDGAESILLVDPDVGFDPIDARRILARPEPVIAGIGDVPGSEAESVVFAPGVTEVRLGPGAPGLYPVERAGAAFVRIRAEALRQMVAAHDLPLCDAVQGRGTWPFFQATVTPDTEGGHSYRGSVETFYRRLTLAGITPMADTSIVLVPAGRASPWSRAATSWDQIPGMFDFLAVYDDAVAGADDGAVFVEVGCLAGRSTCYLASRIRESGKEIALYAVDTGRGSASDSTGQEIAPSVGGTLAGVLHRNVIGCGVNDIVAPIITTSIRAARLFATGSIDFCFIDADHSYESVTADLLAWWPKIRPGGILAGHDYRQGAAWLVGVTPAVHGFFGVTDAAHPLCGSCWSVRKPLRGDVDFPRPGLLAPTPLL